MHNILKTTLACLAMLTSSYTSAALVNYEITGDVIVGDGSPGAFGLVIGDTITATGTIDDSFLSGGTFSFDTGSSYTMTIIAGTATFTASDDTRFLSGLGPDLTFDGAGQLTDFDFTGTVFNSNFMQFDNLFAFTLLGVWRPDVTITAPVPAAVWLFGSGLLGLVGIARKKKV